MVSGRGCCVFLKILKCSGVPASLHGALTVWERRVTSHDLPGLQHWQALPVKGTVVNILGLVAI